MNGLLAGISRFMLNVLQGEGHEKTVQEAP